MQLGPTATTTNCNWGQLQLRPTACLQLQPTATATKCNCDQLQMRSTATVINFNWMSGSRFKKEMFCFYHEPTPMPALDEGPRIFWSAFLLSFFVVYTLFAEPCTDKDDIVSCGTFCILPWYVCAWLCLLQVTTSSKGPYLVLPNRGKTPVTLSVHYLTWRLHLPYLACSPHCLI